MFNNSNGGYSLADLAAVTNGGGNNWGFGGDGAWLIILFLLFAFNGWGGMGFGGFGGNFGAGVLGSEYMMWPWMMTQNTDNIVQNGFNTQALGNQLSALQSSVNSGFGDTALGIAGINQNICSTGNGITSAISNGFSSAEIAANARQIANMQQAFNAQTAVTAGMNTLAGDLQNCCCENRAATADLKYTVATEACADRSAISSALRDVLEAGNANTQRILDTLCQDKIDAKNEKIVELQNQITMKDLAASQAAQTAQLIADNTAQTQYLVNRVAPYPIPSYTVSNPYMAYPYYANGLGCGCGYNNLVA